MTRRFWIAWTTGLLGLFAPGIMIKMSVAAEVEPSLSQLAWLSGCWGQMSDSREIEEHWMRPSGNSMLGMGRTIKNGELVDFEFLRIVQEARGLVLIALPSGQKEASFRLKQLTGNEVVFESPAHDFPQRILYRKKATGELLGRIEGKRNGVERAVDFPMKRRPCP
ncbi:MAG: DUF6265 family protein [Acidobacteriota bacterium]